MATSDCKYIANANFLQMIRRESFRGTFAGDRGI
jgi:hypothetical protein